MLSEIGVVIPWSGKSYDLLVRQVHCLLAQDICLPLDVRVAANSATALTASDDLAAFSTPRRTVRVIDASAQHGPSFARNRGATDAPARFLLFCDADDEVHPQWARRMVEGLTSVGPLVGGSLEYARLNRTAFAISRTAGLPVAFGFLPFTPSASLGITQTLFGELGGFAEDFLSGEDIDLCWRAHYLGCTPRYIANAVTSYRLRQSVPELWKQGTQYGSTDVQLYRRHRSHGLRRTPLDSAIELGRLVGVLACTPFGRKYRLKAVLKLGSVVGHVMGSVKMNAYFI